jgi:4-amino-4-deoxy-L-arabinose transferase-like glycosyltransferase
LLLFYLLTFPGAISPRVSDDQAMYLVTRAIVDRWDVAIVPGSPSEVAVTAGWQPVPLPTGFCPTERSVLGMGERPGGPFFVKYGIGQSIAAVPLYVLGRLVALALPLNLRDETAAFVTSMYCSIITALTAALLCALALRLGWSGRTALALALLFGLATPAWAYTSTFFSEPTIGLCLVGAVTALLWDSMPTMKTTLTAGCWLGAATLTHLGDTIFYALIPVAFILLYTEAAARLRLLIALCAPIGVALLCTAWYDLARYGSPLRTGYGIVGDHHDLHPPHTLQGLWEGIYGPILSPGKGLLLYAPILILALLGWRRLGRQVRGGLLLVAGLCTVAVLVHANTLIIWLGGWAWGPRFVIPIIAIALLPLGVLLEAAIPWARVAAWLLGAAGMIIQLPGVLLDKGVYISYLNTHETDAQGRSCIWHTEDLYKWHPQYSPIIGQWQRFLDPGTYTLGLPRWRNAASIADGRLVPEPHTWWAILAAQAVAWPVLGCACAVLALGAAATLGAAVRAT